MTEAVALTGDGVSARVSALGAQLTSLTDADGHECLWDGGPAWPWHAPVLFPQICRANDDVVRVGGWPYALPHHGFARSHEWRVEERSADAVRMAFETDPQTRRHYPYDAELEACYRVADGALRVTFTVRNRSAETMPFMLGWHPAFRWPLGDGDRSGHCVALDGAALPVPRLTRDNLLIDEYADDVLVAGELPLSPETFRRGGLVFEQVPGRSLTYAGGRRRLRLRWSGFHTLTVWSPPGAGFVCLEPWAGLPETAGDPRELADRDGVLTCEPHGSWQAGCVVEP